MSPEILSTASYCQLQLLAFNKKEHSSQVPSFILDNDTHFKLKTSGGTSGDLLLLLFLFLTMSKGQEILLFFLGWVSLKLDV